MTRLREEKNRENEDKMKMNRFAKSSLVLVLSPARDFVYVSIFSPMNKILVNDVRSSRPRAIFIFLQRTMQTTGNLESICLKYKHHLKATVLLSNRENRMKL